MLWACVLAFRPVWGGTTGRISGFVKDAHGSPLPKIKISVTSTAMGIKTIATTDKNGLYNFLTLAAGTYVLGVEAKGFKPVVRPGIVVHVDSAIQIDLVLDPDGSESK
jgi:hypothetical protein